MFFTCPYIKTPLMGERETSWRPYRWFLYFNPPIRTPNVWSIFYPMTEKWWSLILLGNNCNLFFAYNILNFMGKQIIGR
jgi:hypothetical protein